jgi:hypothetical protein
VSIFGRRRPVVPPRAWFHDCIRGDYYRTPELVTLELNQVRAWHPETPGKLSFEEELIIERSRIECMGGIIRTPALAWGNRIAQELY